MTLTKVAQVALDKALQNGGHLIIPCESEAQAMGLRFRIYRERTKLRKQIAKLDAVPASEVETEWDDLQLFVEPNHAQASKHKYPYRVVIKPVPSFAMLDPTTGELI